VPILQSVLRELISTFTPVQYIFFLTAAIVSGLFAYCQIRNLPSVTIGIKTLISFISILQIVFLCFLWINHIGFPLNLEPMELTVLQHVVRVINGMPLYPEPSSEFVALAYHPLYYYLAVPFTYIFGASLTAIRFVAILGMLGVCLLVYSIILRNTSSHWFALITVAVFASAYRVMETYLDNAFPDSWMLLSILMGCYLIDLNRSRVWNMFGVVCLVISYWFKQPGAAFAVGAVLYLTWRGGIRKSWPYWLIAALFGPILYFLMPDWILGPYFHYFTWMVPRHWIQFDILHILRIIYFLMRSYLVLATISFLTGIYFLLRKPKEMNIWFAMIPFAIVTSLSGLMDPESAKNLYIPLGVWFIITGIMGLHYWIKASQSAELTGKHIFAILVTFGLLIYDPRTVILPSQANQKYQEMMSFLNSLDGTVYSPWTGQLQNGYKFYPSVHWVPMVDMVRPGYQYTVSPMMRTILEPVIHPKKNAYIFTPIPLDQDPALSFLSDYYILDDDLGDRFEALKPLPKEYNIGWPRYLYRYNYSGPPN
jgi:hypothetical protein